LQAASAAITGPPDSGITGIISRSPGVLGSSPKTPETLALDPLRVAHAETDECLGELWLHGRGTLTVAAYAADVGGFLEMVGKPIRSLMIGDLQGWVGTAGICGIAGAR
jgi:hypothetical protein